MAQLADVQNAISELNGVVHAQAVTSNNLITAVTTQLQALQAQVAAGVGVTAADLDAVVASVKAIETSIPTQFKQA